MQRKLRGQAGPHKTGRRRAPRLTTYRKNRGRFEVSTTSGMRLAFTARAGTDPELSPPVVVCPVRYPWRLFIADLRELADLVEFGMLDGPGDVLAFLDDDQFEESAA